MEIQNRLNIWRNKNEKVKKYNITVFKGKQKKEKKRKKKMIEGWMSKGK